MPNKPKHPHNVGGRPARPRRAAWWITALAIPLASLPVVLPTPAEADVAARESRPVIDRVSNVVAQDPKEEGTGPTVVIDGHGFGANPPLVTEAPIFDDTEVGQSALGVWANTRNLHFVDEGTFATDDIGLYDEDSDINSCYLTIGKWTDTQIIVMLDDADLTGACSAIDDDDDMTVQVWGTDDNGGFGDTPPSDVFEIDDVVPLGDRARVDSVDSSSGPLTGGTFNGDGTANPNGTITVSGDRLHEASVVWFGDGGYSGGIAVPKCSNGEDPAVADCFTEGDGRLTVRPPAASSGEDKGVYVNVANGGGTSQLDCITVFTCDGGVFYYQSPSTFFGSFSEDISLEYPDTSIGFAGSKELGESTCPGSAPSGGNELSYSVSATASSGQVNVSGTPMTSRNAGGILSSLNIPMTMTIEEAVNIDVTIEGALSGCAAIPLLGGDFAGIGAGLYMMIGGNLTGSYTYHVTINKGVIQLNTGYTPGGVRGASIVSEACVDDEDEPVPCLETSHEFNAAGTVYFSPLWLDVSLDAGPFAFSASAGVTLAGRVQIGTQTTGYELCYGGTYAVKAELDLGLSSFEYSDAGAFWGPFHLLGNKPEICPLGEIEDDRTPTTTELTAAEPVYDAEGIAITYTATIAPADSTGEVDFTSAGRPIEDCAKVEVVDGVAECTVRYDGTGTFTIGAAYSGDRTHVQGEAELEQVVARAEQVIRFDLPDQGTFGESAQLDATGGDSGEDVTFSVPSAYASVCRLGYDDEDRQVVTYRGIGTCNVVARQAGNGGFKAASNVVEVVEVVKAAQVIDFAAPTDAVTGGQSVLDARATRTAPTYAVDDASAEVCALEQDLVTEVTTVVYLTAGECVLNISAPENATHEAASSTSTITVGEAPTNTDLTVTPETLVATVTPADGARAAGRAAPVAAAPGGSVEFSIDGTVVATVETVDGVAEAPHEMAVGADHVVVATYLEDDPNYLGSTTSAERSDPGLAVEVSSESEKTRGWFTSAVTLTPTCTPTTAPLVGACPSPVVLSKDRVYPDRTFTITTQDGGSATVTVSGIKIDSVGPKIVYTVRPNPRPSQGPVKVKVTDGLSGVRSKETTIDTFRTKDGPVTRYKTVAFDRAGNRSVLKLRYTSPPD